MSRLHDGWALERLQRPSALPVATRRGGPHDRHRELIVGRVRGAVGGTRGVVDHGWVAEMNAPARYYPPLPRRRPIDVVAETMRQLGIGDDIKAIDVAARVLMDLREAGFDVSPARRGTW